LWGLPPPRPYGLLLQEGLSRVGGDVAQTGGAAAFALFGPVHGDE
jgi:hypothetical protein